MAPVLPAPASLALGEGRADVWNHVWGYAFVYEQLMSGSLPTHTTLLGWPEGGSLWFIDTFGALVTLPVQALFGPVAAYNAACALQLWLCGFGAWLLALKVTDSRAGAVFAAVAFATTPHLLAQAHNGISESLAAGWLPLAIWALWGRRWVLGGVLLGICAWANAYYAVFGGLTALVLAAQRRSWRPLAAGAVAVLVAAPALGLLLSTMAAEDALVSRDAGFVRSTLLLHNMTDVVSLFRPGRHYSPDLLANFGEHLLVVVYVGWGLLLASAVALRRRRSWLWAGLALGFGLLTLGPYLYIGGDYVVVDQGWVPLPFLALADLPGFASLSHAYRFIVAASLFLTVCAAMAIAGSRHPWRWALGLCVLRLVEVLGMSPAVWPLPVATVDIPEIYGELEGAILDLPIGVPVLERSVYSLYQLRHGQPSPYGLNDHVPPLLWANRFTRYLIEAEWSSVNTLPARRPWLDVELGRRALVADGLRWVVLHERFYSAERYARVSQLMDELATPVHDDEGVRVYRLD